MPTSPYRRFRSEWLALCALLLALALLATGALIRDRRSERLAESVRLEAQTRTVDENVARQLEGADKALGGVAQLRLRGPASVDAEFVTRELALLTAAMPGVRNMLVLDAGGTVVSASEGEMMGRNLRHRPFFDTPKLGGDPTKLYVQPPFLTQKGEYVMVISRMLIGPDGGFDGVITALLDPEYFGVLLRSVIYAPDMRAAFAHRDGTVFLDMPSESTLPPRGDGLEPLLTRHRLSGDVASTAVDDVGGVERLTAVRTVDRVGLNLDEPMVVAVSRDLGAVLAPWRWRAAQTAVAWLCFAAGAVAALRTNQRRRRKAHAVDAAVAHERRLGAERVEQALQGADLGLWELHVPSGRFVVNERERRLLGFTLDEPLPEGLAWRERIHPEDRAKVDAAILPHLRGEVPSYDCELRMRHRDGHHVWLFSRAMIVERDARGNAQRIVGTHLDISERKRSEAQLAEATSRLRHSEKELRLLADNIPALVSRLDLEQRFRFANRAYADWLQLEPAALLGRTLREVYGEEVHALVDHRIRQALAGKRVVYERDLSTPAGKRRVEFILVPDVDAGGRVEGLFTLATDITARHEAERNLARSEERLSLALEGSGLALFDWNIAEETVYHSGQAGMLRGDRSGPTVTPVREQQRHVHPDDLPNVIGHLRDAVVGATPLYSAEFRLRHAEGHWVWVRARGRVVQRDRFDRAQRLAGTYVDVTERKAAESRLRHLAEFDTLTGLPNRALFGDRLQQAMARAARGGPMALLFLDVDRFKTINDTLGHETGDTVLKVYARRMQAVVRETDTVARLAGDEFTIILEAVRDSAEASKVAAKLVRALGQPIPLADGVLHVTASIGVALCQPGETDEAALLRRADAALYEAKRRGRNSAFCTGQEDAPIGVAA